MELVLNGELTGKNLEYVTGFHNGYMIAETVNELYKDGLTSQVKVLGHMDETSYVVTQYDTYIIQGDTKVRLKASEIRYLELALNSLKVER
jgi:hypothetical protein